MIGPRNGTPQSERALAPREQEWIEWVLPADRPGYFAVLQRIRSMRIIGEGRRGKGEIILGEPGDRPDSESPLAPVLAYGAIETNFGLLSISLREEQDRQISVEIVSHRSDEIPDDFEEARRWTYSEWSPGALCPQCRRSVREVAMHTPDGQRYLLAICSHDRRLWIHQAESGVNRLVPVTIFYNELMLHKNIRDPKIALDSRRLFTGLDSYSDDDLAYAFYTYNQLRTKVALEGAIRADSPKPAFREKLKKLFGMDRHA